MSEAAKVLPWPPTPPPGELKPYYIDWKNPPGQDEPHKETDISVSLQDSVYWYCDKKFRVLSVKPDPENPDAPYPFYRQFPEEAPEGQPKHVNQINSGPAKPESVPSGQKKGYLYKPVFEFEDGTTFDPHIRTNQ
jgi:hypothetical protein